MFRYGEILEHAMDADYESDSGNVLHVKKGDKAIIGFDNLIHCLNERASIKLREDDVVEGFSAEGLAGFITAWLDKNFDLEKVLRWSEWTTDETIDDFRNCITAALVEIGMSLDEGNEEDEEI